MTADLFDEIDFAQQIDAERRRDDVPAVGGRRSRRGRAPRRIRIDVGVRHRSAEQRARAASRRRCSRCGAARVRVPIDDRARRLGRRRSAPSARSRAAARSTGALMSAPRSKRDDASVFRPSRLLVRRTDAGLKYALSNATVFVVARHFGTARRPSRRRPPARDRGRR